MNVDPKYLRETSLLSEKIINKIENYCMLEGLDLATFEKLCRISIIDEEREHAEKVALLAESVALKIGLAKKSKAAFFAGLIYNDIGGVMLPYNIFNGREENAKKRKEIKYYLLKLFDKCSKGSIFMAYCVGLKRSLAGSGCEIESKDFPHHFSVHEREELLRYVTTVEALVKICDEKTRQSEEKEIFKKGVPVL